MRRNLLLIISLLFLYACSDSDSGAGLDQPAPPPEIPEGPSYNADIVWTEYGIPHITAEDWGSLGHGMGYAFARENYCVYMRNIVFANGQSAELLGDEGDLNYDFVMKMYNTDEALARVEEVLSERGVALFEGYAAGVSRYFRETGADNLAEGEEGCRGEAWTREITLRDALASAHKTILQATADPFYNELVAATPPATTAATSMPPLSESMLASVRAELSQLTPEVVNESLGIPTPEQMGSNAYGVGRDASGINSGVLYGNPHFPWQGENRFFMAHQTIPGEYDVMGAGLFGVPLANIGFNKDTAWSHTVSTARRFSLHELTVNPGNPLEYLYDGEAVALEPVTVSAVDGSGVTQEHTFYMSQFGPIADLGGLNGLLGGWPTLAGTIFAFNDANKENVRGLETWINFGQAESLDDILNATAAIGIPWVNTIAADRHGEGFYGDISVVPHATNEKINNCVRGLFGPILLENGVVSLDGSDPACELGNDPDTPAGVLGFDQLPKFRTLEYGANANDSYWLPNPRNLLTGFSRAIGPEEYEQSLRTRLTFVQAEERLAGTDELEGPGFTNQQVRDMLTSARNYAAELVNDDLVALCSAVTDWSVYTTNTAEVAEACTLLSAWDTRHTIDSVGGHIFYEFWLQARNIDGLWVVPFDATDPVNTPNTLNSGDVAVADAVLQALATGVDTLVDAGIAMNLPWGDVQFDEKNGERIPIHGGSGRMLFSVITSDLVPGEGYSAIRHGNSYIQAVSWDETDCPDANAILTYSQSTDPASPHYADATRLYSESGWIDMPFCEADRDAQEIGRMTIEE